MMTYRSEESAFARVNALRLLGIWPGVIRVGRSSWRLTYDPPAAVTHLTAHGYEMNN
jgi:hypothetical protein